MSVLPVARKWVVFLWALALGQRTAYVQRMAPLYGADQVTAHARRWCFELQWHLAFFGLAAGAEICGGFGWAWRILHAKVCPFAGSRLGQFVSSSLFDLCQQSFLAGIRLAEFRTQLLRLQFEAVHVLQLGEGHG